MTVQTRAQYETLIEAIGICVSARIPFLLWGAPGEGKTAVIESASESGWLVETLIVSHYEPSDFAGLPVIGKDGSVSLAPPEWAKRLAAYDGPSIAFFDEWTTAPPAVQAAALRPLTHHQVGALQLPPTVAFGAAANPADVAVGGWELAAPTANRFCHIDWSMPLEVYAECTVTGAWPTIPLHPTPAAYPAAVTAMKVMISGFLRARSNLLSAIPKDAASRGMAFPTPRTWDYLARLVALTRSIDADEAVVTVLASGAVGPPTAHEFLAWAAAQDLPDPEKLLADPACADFAGMRPDRVYVVLQSLLSAFTGQPSPERWSAAIRVCAAAANTGSGLDPAVPVVRALVRDGVRPADAQVPAEIKVFAAPLALAGLMPEANK